MEKNLRGLILKIKQANPLRVLSGKRKGMTFIEALVGIALMAIAVIGLAQLFTYGILNNSRADRIANATFLAQQQIEFLRNLTGPELSALSAGNLDEQIDVNNDGTLDYRRITVLQSQGAYTEIRVLVFGPAQISTQRDELLANPSQHRVMADIRTILAR
jgi:type II secretory pathway pseudopilin PulG